MIQLIPYLLMLRRLVLLACALFAIPSSAQQLSITFSGRYATGTFDDSAAENVAYHAQTQRVFFVNSDANTVVALDYSDPSNPTQAFDIDVSPYGDVSALAVSTTGLLAVAAANADEQLPGTLALFDVAGTFRSQIAVGAGPGMVTFTPDGSQVLVANEGQPNDAYTVDPEGSVSVVSVSAGAGGLSLGSVQTASFADFNVGGSRAADLPDGVRIYGPGASVAQDLEPEHVALNADGSKAYVSLQENNAMAVIDVATATVDAIYALGFKDHGMMGNGLDPSDRDDRVDVRTFSGLFGMYQPDALATFVSGGTTYVVTANEGDARDYNDVLEEEERVKDLVLDPAAFPDAATLQEDEALGRLDVTTTLGDTDGDGDYDALYSFGGRSFSVFDAQTGALVFDSGDAIERKIAELLPADFNSGNDENDDFDGRSDNKGPEPKGVAIGAVGGTTYAFVTLERIGGVMAFDLTNPTAPTFAAYVNSRDFSVDFDDTNFAEAGDLGPGAIAFVSSDDSPTQTAMLIVAHEVSGTVAGYALNLAFTTTDIGQVRGLDEGTQVQIEGVVTTNDYGFNNGQFNVQDATGGVNVFASGSAFGADTLALGRGDDSTIKAGDRVRIIGEIDSFNDQVQVSATRIAILSSGNDLPDAVRALPLGFDADSPLQGQRIELPFVRLADPSLWPTEAIASGSGLTVGVVTLSGDTLDVRIDRGESAFDGSPAPEGLFTIQGVLARFRDTAQLLPFFEDELDDIGEGQAQFFHGSKAASMAEVQVFIDQIVVGSPFSYGEATPLILIPSEVAYELSIATGTAFTEILATEQVDDDEGPGDRGSIFIAAGDPNATGEGAFGLFVADLPYEREVTIGGTRGTIFPNFFHGIAGADAIELRTLFPTDRIIAATTEDGALLTFGSFSGTFELDASSHDPDIRPIEYSYEYDYTFAVTPPDAADTRNDALALFGGGIGADIGVYVRGGVTLVVAGTTAGGLRADFFAVARHGSVKMLDATTVSTDGNAFDTPAELTLSTPAPHPVSGASSIRYGIPQPGHARLTVFDTLGREIARLVDAHTAAGWHDASLDGSSLSSGVYLYRLEAGGQSTTGTLTVVR